MGIGYVQFGDSMNISEYWDSITTYIMCHLKHYYRTVKKSKITIRRSIENNILWILRFIIYLKGLLHV